MPGIHRAIPLRTLLAFGLLMPLMAPASRAGELFHHKGATTVALPTGTLYTAVPVQMTYVQIAPVQVSYVQAVPVQVSYIQVVAAQPTLTYAATQPTAPSGQAPVAAAQVPSTQAPATPTIQAAQGPVIVPVPATTTTTTLVPQTVVTTPVYLVPKQHLSLKQKLFGSR